MFKKGVKYGGELKEDRSDDGAKGERKMMKRKMKGRG